MSEHDDRTEAKEERDDVCRDFLKNICNRGSRCKFFHPPDHKPSAAAPTNDNEYNFCIDYQNRGCRRDNCRFVHAPRDEVERYKETRELTLVLARAIAAAGHGDTIGSIPICKEFQTGRCARGAQRCRYWHVNVELERQRRARGLPPTNEFAMHGGPPDDFINGAGGGAGPFMGGGGPPGPMGGNRRRGYDDGGYDEMEMKRPRMSGDQHHFIELEKRNVELQKEVDSLRRELKREHERYEDLYALFRQQSGGAPAPPKINTAPTDYYSSNSAPAWGALSGGGGGGTW